MKNKDLTERQRKIFQTLVKLYLETGDAVGSNTVLGQSGLSVSSATIRNVMADLEKAGLLNAPHISSGRLPTEQGLRMYVDGLMEIGDVTEIERAQIEAQCLAFGSNYNDMFRRTGQVLSGLTKSLSLVIAPSAQNALKNIQFLRLDPGRILVVIVFDNGHVENRLMEDSAGIPDYVLEQATNFINRKASGLTLDEAERALEQSIRAERATLDHLTQDLIEKGIAVQADTDIGHLIVKGRSNLLNDIKVISELEAARELLATLEQSESIISLLGSVSESKSVRIFIGSENQVFDQHGWSLMLKPYHNSAGRVLGALGVIGPQHINYGRIIPLLDYTSDILTKMMKGA